MFVSFSVSNFRSFSSEETFSLVASKRFSGSHEEHAVPIPDSDEKVLRTAVLYGANAAGKSNLFKALRYFKSVALKPGKKNGGTGREPFKFEDFAQEPSSFDLQFVVGNKLYRFGFCVDDERIIEEWLVQVKGTKELVVYERKTDEKGRVKIKAAGLKRNDKLKALATIGGPQNQSFLATIRATLDSQDVGAELNSIILWLDKKLTLIAPNESFNSLGSMLATEPEFLTFAGDFLKSSSTGIDHLKTEKKVISESDLRALLPQGVIDKIMERLDADSEKTVAITLGEGNEVIIERKNEDQYYRISVHAAHKLQDGGVIPLDLSQESDGTRRLLNLLPALHHLRTDSAVYFIDEIDRSMHPMLVSKFLEFFLKSCEGGQRQIVVTTHESNLLDLELVRRDEIWFAEKDLLGATHLYSLMDFKVRKDLEVRKHYLQGRFGAVPFLGDIDRLLDSEVSCDAQSHA